jgi:hypothetical protein
MSQHRAPPAAPHRAAAQLAPQALLEHCRRLAGARLNGDWAGADAVARALRSALPLPEAHRMAGLLHDLVAGVAGFADGFRWHPPGARWPSPDEAWLLDHALRPLSDPPPVLEPLWPATATALPASHCPTADRACGLAALAEGDCAGACPFMRPGTRPEPGFSTAMAGE